MAKILVIDDDKAYLELINELLTLEGHSVKTASNILDFDAYLTVWKPDLICADIHMPDIAGDRLSHRLKNVFGLKTPIVVISSDVERLEKMRVNSSAEGYINKSYLQEELSKTIKTLLEKTA